MVRAKAQFDDSFTRIARIDVIYQHAVVTMGLPEQEMSDLLRTQIVYGMSALDRLIHDLVKIGLINIFLGRRLGTAAYTNMPLTLGQHADLTTMSIVPAEVTFKGIIEAKHSYLTFQDPSKIKDALSYIWNEPHKWHRIAAHMGSTETVVKETLSNIVIRRNQIVHEMDLDLASGAIQPITRTDTLTSVQFVRDVGNAIFDLVV